MKKAILLFGGCTSDCSGTLGEEIPATGDTVVNDTWSLDGGDWTEKTPAAPPSIRCCVGMAYVGFGFNHVVVFMGQDEDPGEEGRWGLPGIWYWQWDNQGGDGEWVVCDGTNDSCT